MEKPPDNPDAPVIEMTGVTVGTLRDLQELVLEGVNWTVRKGDFWAIGGMHGSGKSDFLYMTAGLTPPQAGCYRLFGFEMPIFEGELLNERLRIGLVFDDGHLFHNLTVRENIELPFRYHKHADWQELEQHVTTLLDLTELRQYGNVTAVNLGRNLQKRAGLARALALQPEVLLLDNPVAGVDLREITWWMNLLNQLSTGKGFMEGRPVTIVVTAEDLRPWRARASHFAFLQDKRFTGVGGARELEHHTESMVRELLAESTTKV
jgi:phospholipid/cholesterol/gamma-HCH transport system ATP-binding protein